jgi:Ni/Co efflux regulator RcnB
MTPLKTLLAVTGLSLVIAGAAGAQGWGRHGGDHGGGDRGGGRGGGEHGGRREELYAPRGGERGGPGPYSGRSPYSSRPMGGPGFAPRGYVRPDFPSVGPSYAPSPRSWGRGQFLPPSYWSGQAVDPRRYRLRTPPPGYGWYGVGRDAYLVQRSTGLILDTAPGAW